jgi:hypothetical protein
MSLGLHIRVRNTAAEMNRQVLEQVWTGVWDQGLDQLYTPVKDNIWPILGQIERQIEQEMPDACSLF